MLSIHRALGCALGDLRLVVEVWAGAEVRAGAEAAAVVEAAAAVEAVEEVAVVAAADDTGRDASNYISLCCQFVLYLLVYVLTVTFQRLDFQRRIVYCHPVMLQWSCEFTAFWYFYAVLTSEPLVP